MNGDLIGYYARRAREYERIYEKPGRQADLAMLRQILLNLVRGRDVLEVACGTGYWTEIIATAARSVLATDATAEVLEIARRKPSPPGRVRSGVHLLLVPHISGARSLLSRR